MASDNKNVFVENMQVLLSPDGMQKYLFGFKKNGTPRAVYDIVSDYTKPKKKKHKKKGNKGKKNKNANTSFEFYLNSKKNKKKSKKHKKNKYWHI